MFFVTHTPREKWCKKSNKRRKANEAIVSDIILETIFNRIDLQIEKTIEGQQNLVLTTLANVGDKYTQNKWS